MLSREEAAKFGVVKKPKGSVTIESEFEKIKQVTNLVTTHLCFCFLLIHVEFFIFVLLTFYAEQIDINNWEQKRGPRPWEKNDASPAAAK